MASPSEAPGKKRPSDRVIAFALSIVRSKPSELSIEEYIQLLRHNVTKGRRDEAISFTHRHLDTSSIWRSKYERLKCVVDDIREDAQKEAISLKRELDCLKAKCEASELTGPPKKQKRPNENVLVPPSSKRKKQDNLSRNQSALSFDRDFDFDIDGLSKDGDALAWSFYKIGKILQSGSKIEPPVLAHHLVHAASILPQEIEQTQQQCLKGNQQDRERLKSFSMVVSQSMKALVLGLNKLGRIHGGADVQGQVVYAYVQSYKRLVEILSELAKIRVTESTTEESNAVSDGKPSGVKSKQPIVSTLTDIPALNSLTKVLCGVVDMLDLKIETDRALFEGLSYVVLEKLGARLYMVTFGRPRAAALEDQIAESGRRDEPEDGESTTTACSDELELRVAKLEAPYLIHLLSRIMNASPAYFSGTKGNITGKAKVGKGPVKNALAISARERLQRTLVNCIFGTDVDEDDPFMDCLKMPKPRGSALPIPKIEEANVVDWFKEEAWRLLGWEILAREGI